MKQSCDTLILFMLFLSLAVLTAVIMQNKGFNLENQDLRTVIEIQDKQIADLQKQRDSLIDRHWNEMDGRVKE